jgi:hypothetical protein
MTTHPATPSVTVSSDANASKFSRAAYAVAAGGASVAAVGVGVLLASRGMSGIEGAGVSGGDQQAALLGVGGVLLLGVLLCAVPMLPAPLVKRSNWGMVVMMVSLARTMLAMGAMLVLVEMMQLPRQPVVVGLLVGTLITIFAEAAGAVWVLSKLGQMPGAGARPVRSL